MSELQLDRAGRRRSPATMPGFHAGHAPGNKGLRYPADPPKCEEIVAVMRAAGERVHGCRLRGSSWSCGVPGCASKRRSRSARAISINAVARCWSVVARAEDAAKSVWTHGAGSSFSPGTCGASSRSVRCCASSTARRATLLVTGRGTSRTAPHRRRGGSAAPLRAAPAPSRPRRRDGTRGRAADRHPAPTPAQQPRHHVRVPAGHRQRRDHRDRPFPPRTNDPRQRLAPALIHGHRDAPHRAMRHSACRASGIEGRRKDRCCPPFPAGRAGGDGWL